MSDPRREEEAETQESCAPGMSRKEFLAAVVKKASLVGALTTAPLMVDAFLAPSAHANPSDVTDCALDPATDPGIDTLIICTPGA